MKWQVGAALITLCLLAAACTAGGTTTITEDSIGATGQNVDIAPTPVSVDQVEPSAVPAPPTAAPEPTAAEPAPTADTTAPGASSGRPQVGECFDNSTPNEAAPSVGTAIDCQGEHEYEVFFQGEFDDGPTAPFPTGQEFIDGLFADFCNPATIEFAGEPWDQLPFDVSVWTPSQEEWQAGDRSFMCTAEAGLRDENIYKIGTAAGGSLDSDEGVVARSTVDGQRDFFFSFEASTLYPLTSGQYELPNTSPSVVPGALLFASPLQDFDAPAFAYDYLFDTEEVTRLETGLDGWEHASPYFLPDIPAFVFAARENDQDDWDIFVSRGSDDVLNITTTESDAEWPAITPDQQQVVYSADDDIWIMNLDGSDKQQLTSDAAGDFEMAVSPDGTQIVFASDRSGNDDIWIMNIDGSDQRNLTNHPADEAWPFFSADGTKIYFQTDRLGVRANIMMMAPDGSNPSYYSREFMTNAVVLSVEVTEQLKGQLRTVNDVLEDTDSGVVPGSPNEITDVSHSSGRLQVPVPGSWQWQEVETDDVASMIVSPNIGAYQTVWAADGAQLTLVEAASNEDFLVRLTETAAPNDTTCVETSRTNESDGPRIATQFLFDCGERSAAVVTGVFQSEDLVGLVFEGQWDRDPSDAADSAQISAIGQGVTWR